MKTLDKEQAFIVSAYTGLLAMSYGDFLELVEKRLGKPVMTHEMADKAWWSDLKEVVKDDFIAMCYQGGQP